MKKKSKNISQFTLEEALQLNPERESLTPEKLRELSGLQDLSDERAQEIIFSIKAFCAILLEVAKEKEPTIISLTENSNQLKQAA